MGDEVEQAVFTGEQRRSYRERLRGCLEVLARMLVDGRFDATADLAGLEVELNLVDAARQPMLGNIPVLAEIADPSFQTELGSFNIELNLPPRSFGRTGAFDLERELRDRLNHAERRAGRCGAHTVMIGILPTLTSEHLTTSGWMSPSTRYSALNDSMAAARGEDFRINISGVEHLLADFPTLAPESACTSAQFHLQVAAEEFAGIWNSAQAVAGPQVALGANSPFFLGRHLWQETRIVLFRQATDTRPAELRNQGVRPRVWFGDRWITSALDLFEENIRFFPPLLPETSPEDPVAAFREGAIPALRELRLHNGTIYRWNRPIYDVRDGRPHLRVENRVLPAGPTVVDMVANGVFFYGVVGALRGVDPPVWQGLSFEQARGNFERCARWGMAAVVDWPGRGRVPVDRLIVDTLVPMAHQGLSRFGVAARTRDRYLGIIEARARTGRNGAAWQVATVGRLQEDGLDRRAALTEMLRRYCDGMHSNEPVHTWPVPGRGQVLGP